MSKRKQETVSDIISMMRDWDCYSHLSEAAHNEIFSFANRIEKAHRRSYDKYKEHTNELNRQILVLKKEKEVSDARFEICQKVNEQQEKEYLSMERKNAHLRAALKPVLDCKVMGAVTAEIEPGKSEYCAAIIEKAQRIYYEG